MLSLYESTIIHNSCAFYRIKKYWHELKLWSIEHDRVCEIPKKWSPKMDSKIAQNVNIFYKNSLIKGAIFIEIGWFWLVS